MRATRALALLLLAGCSQSDEPRSRVVSLEDIAALGYTDWDASSVEPLPASGEPDARPFLYADDRSTVRLMANDGAELRRWTIPGASQVEYAELDPEGGVVALSVDEGVTRVDAEGELVWRWSGNAHHELAPRAMGGWIVPVWRVHEYRGRSVRFDELVWLTASGAEERRWSTFEHREQLSDHHALLPLDEAEAAVEPDGKTYDQFHVNTVVELAANQLGLGEPAGSVLVCARNASLVFVLDAVANRILWSWGPGELDFPHTPTPTARGLLVFDNGYHRGASRLIEIEPSTQEVVWEWSATGFFSRTRGSCQRLENGHTFVCESARGRLFELDRDGRVVWSWVNPEERDGKRRRIYRACRVSAL